MGWKWETLQSKGALDVARWRVVEVGFLKTYSFCEQATLPQVVGIGFGWY